MSRVKSAFHFGREATLETERVSFAPVVAMEESLPDT